jgi:hypothetical protein
MWLLAQQVNEIREHALPAVTAHPWTILFVEIFGSLFSIIYVAFFVWMLIHCYLHEPDRWFWVWIMIIAQGVGPIAYFLLRYVPSREFPAPAFLRRWTRARELARLETAAEQIGNAHQFVQWGDGLRELGLLGKAGAAYARALKKDPDNLQALWGAAQFATQQKQFADVIVYTKRVLDKDPQYKFGDVSLAHARALNELGQREAARTHLEQHVRRWRHPEALYLLATLCASQGDVKEARHHLTGLIQDINGCPSAIARKFGRWKSLSRQMLRRLPGN